MYHASPLEASSPVREKVLDAWWARLPNRRAGCFWSQAVAVKRGGGGKLSAKL